MTILDGPMGTELLARGVPTPTPLWSAGAIHGAPEVVQAIHRDYAAAGATVHTANTFRARHRQAGEAWAGLARRAVELARQAVPPDHRVAGSVAPLEDCYRPDLSPAGAAADHRAMAAVLAAAGVDILLCETFPHVGEGLAAVTAAVATGVETWVAFTAGPDANLLTPRAVGDAARAAVDLGARTVLVNCVPADRTLEFVRELAGLAVPFGAYANAGAADAGMGWAPAPGAPLLYLDHVRTWVDAGATVVGSCCGTGPAHIAALAAEWGPADAWIRPRPESTRSR